MYSMDGQQLANITPYGRQTVALLQLSLPSTASAYSETAFFTSLFGDLQIIPVTCHNIHLHPSSCPMGSHHFIREGFKEEAIDALVSHVISSGLSLTSQPSQNQHIRQMLVTRKQYPLCINCLFKYNGLGVEPMVLYMQIVHYLLGPNSLAN